MKTGALIAVVMCACAADADDVGPDAGAEPELDAQPPEDADDVSGEWRFAVVACGADLELHVRIATNRGVLFVASLASPIAAAGVDGGRLYVKDGAGVTWYLELADDGATASAAGALDVADGGCEWTGSVAVTERVR